MITTENLTTNVKFGVGETASIGVRARAMVLTLQQLARDKKIADQLEDGDVQDLPRVNMNFSNIESIDVVIKALEHIKKQYIEQFQYALAC